uniref:Uncharacterized protein n=1 Tax=Mustela putorius furo TaxID=9669 RepID=M3Z0W5_MUSPF
MDVGQLTTGVCHDGFQYTSCQTLLLWVSLGPAPPGPAQMSLQPPTDSMVGPATSKSSAWNNTRSFFPAQGAPGWLSPFVKHLPSAPGYDPRVMSSSPTSGSRLIRESSAAPLAYSLDRSLPLCVK